MVQASPLPQEKAEAPVILHAYTESNESYSTFEEIMEEIAARKVHQGETQNEDMHTINKRWVQFLCIFRNIPHQ